MRVLMCFVPYHPGECRGLWAQHFEPAGVDYYAQLLKFEPESLVPSHEHEADQWFIVLEGEIKDEFGSYPKGIMKFYPKGSHHQVTSSQGALVFYVKKKEE